MKIILNNTIPFKIYADFECNLEDVKIYEGSYTKKYHEHIPCSFAYKVVCINDKFSKPIVVYRGKNAACEEGEHLFQQSNSCWKQLVNNDEKVRDHCHVTGKFRGAAH